YRAASSSAVRKLLEQAAPRRRLEDRGATAARLPGAVWVPIPTMTLVGGHSSDTAALVAPATAIGTAAFGRLEAVGRIRDFWADEARDFTPWLAQEDNLALLAETIGLSLELVGTEQRVGPFRADIVAADEQGLVVIENQLNATDHKHLGQLLVYAADRKAHTVVWVAKQVTDEYRKVIDWLNEQTNVRFWALEIELWRIGDSPVAPKFNVACEPNEIARVTAVAAAAGESVELSDVRLLQIEFWEALSAYLDEHSSFSSRKARPQNWYPLGIGTARAYVACTVRIAEREVGCELYMPGRHGAETIFTALEGDREAIEAEFGEALDFQELPERKACRIALQRDGDISDRETWPELHAWMTDEKAERFKAVFAQRIKDIAIDSAATAAAETPRGDAALA
ncbi:MAG: DUF4268 domain-containing protein, partial [Chloroflexota bacterium]|nr:DUF4268 domain-containing protein [Chloroflexota bacterium]